MRYRSLRGASCQIGGAARGQGLALVTRWGGAGGASIAGAVLPNVDEAKLNCMGAAERACMGPAERACMGTTERACMGAIGTTERACIGATEWASGRGERDRMSPGGGDMLRCASPILCCCQPAS